MKTKTKTFDCVEMMHEGARRVQAKLEGMTVEQETEYWRKRGQEFRKLQALLRRQMKQAKPSRASSR
jgi:hypothetical protein